MTRDRSNLRAQRILDAAALEFANRGLAGARVDRIAEVAGVNKQLIFYYFQSKEGLHGAVVEHAAERLGGLVERLPVTATTAQGRLRELLLAQFDVLATRRELAALLSREAAAAGGAGTLAPAIRRLVTVIAEGQGRGAFRDDVDPHLLAAQALVLQLGFLELEPVLATSAIPLGADGSSLPDRWKEALAELIVRGAAT